VSTTVDPQAGSPPDDLSDDLSEFGDELTGGLTDEEVLVRCREIEERRRADLAEHLRLLRQLERRKLYFADGHRDLAGFGRAEYRWADRDARAHRDLERLCRVCPQILDQLTIGRVGTAQAFLLARLSRAPRVGVYVAEQIDDFLEHAAQLSYLAFEQYVLAWKCLMDQDGADPDRAHRNRKASMSQSGLSGTFGVEGPAIDHARLKVLMEHFEQIEFQRDWAAAEQQWGDDMSVDRMARTAMQRRYDAFQNLLDHVTLPKMPNFTNTDPHDGTDTPVAPDNEPASNDDTTKPATPEPATPEPVSAVETVLNIVIDGDSFLHGLNQLLGINLFRQIRTPFGPDRAFCHTFDGDTIARRDAVLTGITSKVRPVLRGPDSVPTVMTSATRCQIDHLHPHHRGGVTDVTNGGLGCGHHNRWRHTANATIVRLTDGTLATYRPNGTRIAPPI